MKTAKDLIVVIAFVGTLAALDWGHRKYTNNTHSRGAGQPLRAEIDGNASWAQIRKIVHERCGDCHYAGGPSPFALATHDDVAKRGEQVVQVTQSGYMPPWLPTQSDYAFAHDRSMPESERQAIADWVRAGMPGGSMNNAEEGFAQSPKEWQLGPPDLVLELAEPYRLEADTPELFWNFVLSAQGGTLKDKDGGAPPSKQTFSTPRYVRAVEIKPGNRQAVHHVIGQIDRTGSARRKQQQLGTNGFPGMEFEQGEIVPGLSMLWSPGKAVSPGNEGVAWSLTPQTDVLLQMHLFPTGKPELVRPKVGIYFADEPPTAFPLSLMLEVPTLEIPAGETNYVAENSLETPVDLLLLSVYPHAHYIATSFTCEATLPDNSKRTILRIDDWDFNWQDEYVFEQPVPLPSGTVVSMQFTYDNSEHNIGNPNHPPKRIVLGNRSTDEMGSALLQVLVANEADSLKLDESRWLQKLTDEPLHPTANQNLGNIYEARGELARARACYQRVLQVRPNDSVAHDNLANALSLLGDSKRAEHHFRNATELNPTNPLAYHHWGAALLRAGRLEEAVEKTELAVEYWPEFPEANINLGKANLLLGDTVASKRYFRRAIEFAPDNPIGHFNLGTVLMRERNFPAASERFHRATELRPEFVEAYNNLGICLYEQGKLEAAAQTFRRVLELDPGQENASNNLGIVESELKD